MHSPLALLDALLLRLPLPQRLARFMLVGASGTVVNFGALALALVLLPDAWGVWEHRLSMAGAIAVSIFSNFLLNDAWTWGDRPKGGRGEWLGRLLRFYVVSCAGALVQWFVAVWMYEHTPLESWFGPAGVYVAQACGINSALVVNYTANTLWTFRKRSQA